MRRRDFISLVGGAAAAWPLAAHTQQSGRVPLMGWLDPQNEIDPLSRSIRAALQEGLADFGWIEGRNLKIERRFGAADAGRMRAAAAELVALAPDIIVAGGASPARALQRATQTIPIVFTGGGDATVTGLVKNIARPEGNITGFVNSEPTIGEKWLELLKAAAPSISRVGIVFNPTLGRTSPHYIAAIEVAAQRLLVSTVKIPVRDIVELVRSIDAFAAEPDGGIVLLPPSALRATVLQLANQHRLPAMYALRTLTFDGGLLSYSTDFVEQHRRAASYVDRLLRGAKVTDLPVQLPTKYKLVINVRAAKAIGLTIPEALLLQADELIE